MKTDIRDRWVAKLESGEYAHGRTALTYESANGKRFCCLGVLCEIAVEDGIIERKREVNYCGEATSVYQYGSQKNSYLLPEEVVEWAGLESSNPKAATPGRWHARTTLAYINDNARSFDPVIALIKTL